MKLIDKISFQTQVVHLLMSVQTRQCLSELWQPCLKIISIKKSSKIWLHAQTDVIRLLQQ